MDDHIMSDKNIVILSKKEFQNICKGQKDIRIVASTDLKEAKEGADAVVIRGCSYRTVNKKMIHRVKGYVMLDNGDYVRVLKKNPLVVIIPLIIILLFLLITMKLDDHVPAPIKEAIGLEDTEDISDEKATNFVSYVNVPGFKEEISLDQNTPNIALRNPDDNEWNLYYELVEENNKIYQTKMITPGKQHNCNLKGVLNNGWHTITILTYTATADGFSTGAPVASQTIRVHIA